MDNYPKIIAIVGPTATGKSDLGVFLAKKLKGEIISADSRQVYKGMNIGTGKITKTEMRGVQHYFLDIISPARGDYNVYKFRKAAQKKILEIAKHGHVPLVVGGTGFWVDAVAQNSELPDVPPNPKLRKELNKLSAEKLFSMLKKLNPERAANIDKHNSRRLVRAIEISKYLKTGAPSGNKSSFKAETLYIGLDLPDDVLNKNIRGRLMKRLKSGMIYEVEALHKSGVSWQKLENFGLEYRYIARLLQGKINLKQMVEQLFYAIRHYAKRQRTWFKRNKKIHWLNAANKKDCRKQSLELVRDFLAN